MGTGWGKLHKLGDTAAYFESLHIPFPQINALMAGSAECFGGILLLLGLGARLAAIPLVCTMIVAYLTAESDKLKIFSDPDKFLGADPFLFLYASALVLAFGPGVFSLDWLIAKKCAGKCETSHEIP